jgi:ferritin-like metal-binding protein YciE
VAAVTFESNKQLMNSSIKNLNQVLAFQLEGMYEIVKRLQSDIAKVSKSVSDVEMRMAFNNYRQNLGDQRLKLKRIFGYLLTGPYGRKSVHVADSIAQWNDIDGDMLPRLRDVLLSSSLHLSSRYLVTAYTDARYIAMRIGLDIVVGLLDEIIDEEETFSQNIKRLSSVQVNEACMLTTN